MIDQTIEQTETGEPIATGRQRVSALVALTILEVLRASDRPFEVFEEEDTSITMPRRLGLSDVVERRIRAYQEETKKRNRISDEEFGDLVRLVVKRPDARAIFLECGARLAGKPPRRSRLVPRRLGLALAKRRKGRGFRRSSDAALEASRTADSFWRDVHSCLSRATPEVMPVLSCQASAPRR